MDNKVDREEEQEFSSSKSQSISQPGIDVSVQTDFDIDDATQQNSLAIELFSDILAILDDSDAIKIPNNISDDGQQQQQQQQHHNRVYHDISNTRLGRKYQLDAQFAQQFESCWSVDDAASTQEGGGEREANTTTTTTTTATESSNSNKVINCPAVEELEERLRKMEQAYHLRYTTVKDSLINIIAEQEMEDDSFLNDVDLSLMSNASASGLPTLPKQQHSDILGPPISLSILTDDDDDDDDDEYGDDDVFSKDDPLPPSSTPGSKHHHHGKRSHDKHLNNVFQYKGSAGDEPVGVILSVEVNVAPIFP